MVKKNSGHLKKKYFLVFLTVIFFSSIGVLGIVEQIDTNEYVKADVIDVIDSTIVLGSNCTAIVATTTQERADSIKLGLAKEIEIRPNTHDLLVDTVENFNITVEMVKIDDFDGEIYYASIGLKRGKEELLLDSKPSDAIAIALRTNSPVYIKKNVLNEQGQNICK